MPTSRCAWWPAAGTDTRRSASAGVGKPLGALGRLDLADLPGGRHREVAHQGDPRDLVAAHHGPRPGLDLLGRDGPSRLQAHERHGGLPLAGVLLGGRTHARTRAAAALRPGRAGRPQLRRRDHRLPQGQRAHRSGTCSTPRLRVAARPVRARRQLRVVVLLPVFWIAGENLGILFPLVRKRSETRMIGAADADCRGRRQEADGERRQAHEDAAGHQRRLAADPVADVAEHRAAQRAGGEPRLEGAEREQRAHQRREALGKNAGPNTRAAAVA